MFCTKIFLKDKGKINLLNDIFEINKTLNTKYNNYIVN